MNTCRIRDFGALCVFVFLASPVAIASSDLIDALMLSKKDPASGKRIEALLKAGANPNSKDENGNPPIYWAIHNHDLPALKALLKHGADPELRDEDEWTPLMRASYHAASAPSGTSLIRALIDKKADVNASKQGITALSVSVANAKEGKGGIQVIEYLLKAGADPNIAASPVPEKGIFMTPLMDAARKGKTEIARLLIRYGASPATRNLSGSTAAAFAKQSGHLDLAKELEVLESASR